MRHIRAEGRERYLSEGCCRKQEEATLLAERRAKRREESGKAKNIAGIGIHSLRSGLQDK
jgi:hypothetical protein